MIDGVIVKKLEKYNDDRGWLVEIFRSDETDYKPAMTYTSVTKTGIARGPHEHVQQSDLFVFLGPGKFKLYLWDNRKKSKTFKQKEVLEVGEGAETYVLVPPGVIHAYKCISDVPGWIINLPDKLYKGKGKKEEVDEIRWEDKVDSPFKLS